MTDPPHVRRNREWRIRADCTWAGPAFAHAVDLRDGDLGQALTELETLRHDGQISDLVFELRKELLVLQLERAAPFQGGRPRGVPLPDGDMEPQLAELRRQRDEGLISDITFSVRRNLLLLQGERAARARAARASWVESPAQPVCRPRPTAWGHRIAAEGEKTGRPRSSRVAACSLLAVAATLIISMRGVPATASLAAAHEPSPASAPAAVSSALVSASPTLTATPAPTSLPTATPSATATPTSTPTPTAAPTPTSTPSPSAIPTPTPSPSPSPSATPTPSPSPTATATATATPTPSPAPSSTPTATPTATATPTPTPTPTPTSSPAPSTAPTPPATFTPTPPDATAVPAAAATPPAAPSSTPSEPGHAGRRGAATPPGSTTGPDTSALLAIIARATTHQPLIHFHPPAPPTPAPSPAVSSAPASSATSAHRSAAGIFPAAAKIATPTRNADSPATTIVATMLALAGIALLGLVAREILLIARRRPHPSDGTSRSRVTRPSPTYVTGMLLALAVAGTHPAAAPDVGSLTHAATPPAVVAGFVPSPPTLENRPGRTSGSRPTAATTGAAADSPVWLQLLALETVLESGPQDAAAPLTVAGVRDRASISAALVAEEGLYEGAVRNPAISKALVDAAARSGDAEAMTAVSSDLAIVGTWLANAAAADQARSTLAMLESQWSSRRADMNLARPLVTPMEGHISQPFGPSQLAMEPSRSVGGVWFPHYHTGIDIAAPRGTPVHAAADGVVIVAGASTNASGQLVGYGQYIVIQHANGCATLYGHLLDMTVHSGDNVIQGETIGHEGSTGNSTGPHLHFEVRVDGEPVDPMQYLA